MLSFKTSRTDDPQPVQSAHCLRGAGAESANFGDKLLCERAQFGVRLLRRPAQYFEGGSVIDFIGQGEHRLGSFDDGATFADLGHPGGDLVLLGAGSRDTPL
jgi:hypothetical protein